VLIPYDRWSASVTVEQQTDAGRVEVSSGRVWRLGDLESQALELPDDLGLYRVEIRLHGGRALTEARFVGLRYDTPRLPLSEQVLPVVPAVQENGWVRYDLPLPRPQPVDYVRPRTSLSVLERQAEVVPLPQFSASPDTLEQELYARSPHTIRRVELGGASVDQLTVPVVHALMGPSALLVDARSLPPVPIDEVVVGVEPLVMAVRDPGPGPFLLYGGAIDPTRPGAQLQFAAAELRRAAEERVEPGPVRDNPGYVPPEVRSEVAGPGRVLPLEGLTHARSLSGTGLVRVPLDAHVLTHARADLGDLRVVDDAGRQLPYILRRRPSAEGASALPFTRREIDGTSLITVTLPDHNLHVQQLVLHTDAPQFERRVTVSQPRPGRPSTPLRHVDWSSGGRPRALGVSLHRRLGDTLEVRIDNGDDPPLPLERIDLTWEGWELLVVLPDEATLVYGDPSRSPPRYDFAHVPGLGDRVLPTADVGEVTDLQPEGPPMWERALVYLGLGVLGLGLLGVVGLLVRGDPDEPGYTPDSDDAEEE
jgi:hypothetical protein